MTNWIFENWYIVVGLLAVVTVIILACMKFLGLPTKEQVKKIKEWLLWAVSVAESELGNGTGQLKLRYVYDMFIKQFPTAARFISFEYFSLLVDEALEEMRKLLETNKAVNLVILGSDRIE